ncbi:MAG: TraM recognition domain-containing protein [Patescibacteria group bacterium]
MELFLRILAALVIYASLVAVIVLWLRMKDTRKKLEYLAGRRYQLLLILVPKNNEKGPLSAENMFAALHGIYSASVPVQEQFGFEIVARANQILFYAWVPVTLRDFVEGQIYAQYPTVEIKEIEDYVPESPPENRSFVGAEVTLVRSDVFPIKTFLNFEVDPLAGITGVLSKIAEGEGAWIQVLMRPVPDSWKNKGITWARMLKAGQHPEGESIVSGVSKGLLSFASEAVTSFTRPAPAEGEKPSATKVELSGPEAAAVEGIETKVTKLAFETKIRLGAVAADEASALLRLNGIVGAFKQFNTTNLNGFIGKPPTSAPEFLEDFRKRRFAETGFVLNIEELASIFHLPNISVATPSIAWVGSKKGEPPLNLPIEGSVPAGELTLFAETNFRNVSSRFGIKSNDRRLHLYAIGKTGTGKSTMLENMIINDILEGRGVGVVDPHGDLIGHILDFIPEERVKDVVWLAPWDRDFPIGFNVMEEVDPDLKNIVASGVVGIFKKIFGESWGPRLEYILRNAILSLIGYPNATMLGVTRILVDKGYRKKVVDALDDPVLKDFWINEYEKYDPKFRTEAVAPIQNKVGQFLATSTIRNIVGQPVSTISMKEIMDSKKILLMDLSIGKIGEDTSALLGALLITKIQIAALERANVAEPERVDFYLYVDEFQNFATESFAVILSEARKYHLNLIMTNQYIAQMEEIVAKAIFGNVGTLVTFRVGAQDAPLLVKEFEPVFEATDLVNLDNHHVYVKMAIDGVTSNPFSAITLPPQREGAGLKEKIIAFSHERYGRPRELVEQKIREWSQEGRAPAGPSTDKAIAGEARKQPVKDHQELKDEQGKTWHYFEQGVPPQNQSERPKIGESPVQEVKPGETVKIGE